MDWIVFDGIFSNEGKPILICNGNEIAVFDPTLFIYPNKILLEGEVTHWMPLESALPKGN